MDQQIKKSWIAALLSGKYKQGQGLLRRCNGEDVFCCLGVLVDIVTPEDWIKKDSCYAVPSPSEYGDDDTNEGELSNDFMSSVGFTEDDQDKLIRLNDGRKFQPSMTGVQRDKQNTDFVEGSTPQSFEQIAAYIEENL